MTGPDLKPDRRLRALATASGAALLLAAGLGAAWMGRGPLAEAALERWLARQGVSADARRDE